MLVETIITPWILFAASLAFLVFTQRWLQRHLIGLAFLFTDNEDAAVRLYHALMFPGVLLHELSHWVTARLLGVGTGRFVVLPHRDETGILLGHVEVEETDVVRGALIGAAPLVAGLLVTVLAADQALNMADLAAALPTGDLTAIGAAFARLLRAPDFWVWLYLLFAVANAMMPSPEDRRSWPPFIALMALAFVILLVAGFQETVVGVLAGPLRDALNLLAAAFVGITALNLVVMAPVWIVEETASRLMRRRVNYGPPKAPPAETPPAPRAAGGPVALHERPLPVPAPPRNAPPVDLETPHAPYPMFDDEADDAFDLLDE
ncbi:MAG: hypothetical protein M5R40_06105 [Anaerolineae bacterium]|nr:hypothetical protein [Anaerolineae bacterium]